MIHKSGFVSIIGNSNVGKSTLINSILDKKISIITHKVQTTQCRILGILNNKNYQIIFSDTPGMTINKKNIYDNNIKIIQKCLEDSDIILYITDYKQILNNNDIFFKKILKTNIPIIFLMNKIDILKKNQVDNYIKIYDKIIDKKYDFLSISALKKININTLKKKILDLLPIHPPFYPKDYITDKSKFFFVNEIIREKIFILYKKEIPYSVLVTNELFNEEKNIIIIYSNIYIKNINQRIILIGKHGNKIKNLIKKSIKDLEIFFSKKIILKIIIKLKKIN